MEKVIYFDEGSATDSLELYQSYMTLKKCKVILLDYQIPYGLETIITLRST